MDIIGPLQARVMDFVWTADRGVEVPEALGAVLRSGHKVAYTTILTVMRNLARRGILDQKKTAYGLRHTFTANVSRAEYQAQLAQHVVTTYFQGEIDAFTCAYDRGGDEAEYAKRMVKP